LLCTRICATLGCNCNGPHWTQLVPTCTGTAQTARWAFCYFWSLASVNNMVRVCLFW